MVTHLGGHSLMLSGQVLVGKPLGGRGLSKTWCCLRMWAWLIVVGMAWWAGLELGVEPLEYLCFRVGVGPARRGGRTIYDPTCPLGRRLLGTL